MPTRARLGNTDAEKRDKNEATPKGKDNPSTGDFTAQRQIELVTDTRK